MKDKYLAVPTKELSDEIICYFHNIDDDSATDKNLSDVDSLNKIAKRLCERHSDWVLGI